MEAVTVPDRAHVLILGTLFLCGCGNWTGMDELSGYYARVPYAAQEEELLNLWLGAGDDGSPAEGSRCIRRVQKLCIEPGCDLEFGHCTVFTDGADREALIHYHLEPDGFHVYAVDRIVWSPEYDTILRLQMYSMGEEHKPDPIFVMDKYF
jgi:hypothetical protein